MVAMTQATQAKAEIESAIEADPCLNQSCGTRFGLADKRGKPVREHGLCRRCYRNIREQRRVANRHDDHATVKALDDLLKRYAAIVAANKLRKEQKEHAKEKAMIADQIKIVRKQSEDATRDRKSNASRSTFTRRLVHEYEQAWKNIAMLRQPCGELA
jgi:hypothetical protein